MAAMLVVLGGVLAGESGHSQVKNQYLTSPEALAMGNAYVAYVSDEYSLFYNPAGLARNNRWRFYPFDISGSATDQILSLLESSGGSLGGSGIGGVLTNLSGQRIYSDVYTFPFIQIPYFAAGGIFRIKSFSDVNNPVFPEMNYDVFTEYGGFLGFGVPIVPKFFFIGASLKYVVRQNAVTYKGMNPADMYTLLSSGGDLTTVTQQGYAMNTNIGALLELPIPGSVVKPAFGFCWEDLGDLKFHTLKDGVNVPRSVPGSLNVGTSLMYNTPIGELAFNIDVRRLLNTDVEYASKIHYGFKLSLPKISIYGGVSQGYLTGGVEFNFVFGRLTLVTYGDELGAFASARGDRRYLMRFSLGFDFDGIKMGSKTNKRPR
jgi:hypothetical protein